MKDFFKNNGLTITLLIMFTFALCGQFIEGLHVYNDERVKEHHLKPVTKMQYLTSSHLLSSLSENMESEFLQMAIFVFLTRCLVQRGSAESKKLPSELTPEDITEDLKEEEYSKTQKKKSPLLWLLYENSLTLAFVALFLIFFFLHAYGTMGNLNLKNIAHQLPAINFWNVFSESEFWFESFQNWQSEFFSIAAMVVLSIFLRQKRSPQSKKMNDLHSKTGAE